MINLTRNMRVEALGAGTAAGLELQRFSSWLLEVGSGTSGKHVRVPDKVFMDFEDKQAMINDIFPHLAVGGDSSDSAILMPLRHVFSKFP